MGLLAALLPLSIFGTFGVGMGTFNPTSALVSSIVSHVPVYTTSVVVTISIPDETAFVSTVSAHISMSIYHLIAVLLVDITNTSM